MCIFMQTLCIQWCTQCHVQVDDVSILIILSILTTLSIPMSLSTTVSSLKHDHCFHLHEF